MVKLDHINCSGPVILRHTVESVAFKWNLLVVKSNRHMWFNHDFRFNYDLNQIVIWLSPSLASSLSKEWKFVEYCSVDNYWDSVKYFRPFEECHYDAAVPWMRGMSREMSQYTGVSVVDELVLMPVGCVVATQCQVSEVLVLRLAQFDIDRRLAFASAVRVLVHPVGWTCDHPHTRTVQRIHHLSAYHQSCVSCHQSPQLD